MAFSFRSTGRPSSMSYAERFYKRSSFYRHWSGSQCSSRSSASSSLEEETLLAKALYDNLADAPDELSFRKGDVVTVIERDVDGIVGWWLCLLHGRQGIAPGNRLQVIPPFEVNSSFRNDGSQGSLSADDLSDSFDNNLPNGVIMHGPEYDVLPAPVKATHGEIYDYPSPKNMKDCTEKNSGSPTSHPNYATPKPVSSYDDYDIVPSKPRNKTTLKPAELYDIPQPVKSSPDPEQLYDFPARRPKIQQNNSTPSPRSSRPDFQSVTPSFTSVPAKKETSEDARSAVNKSNPDLYETSDLYDTPKSMKPDSQELYDVPPGLLQKPIGLSGKKESPGSTPDYDVPSKNSVSMDEVYDVPPSSFNFRRNGSPSQNHQKSGQEVYDVPPTINNNLIHQVNNNIRNGTNLNSSGSRQIYGYLPQKDLQKSSPYMRRQNSDYDDLPPLKDTHNQPRQNYPNQPQNDDIYDHPPARPNTNDQHQSEELYDTPPTRQTNQPLSDDIYDHPPPRQNNHNQHQNEDIYDLPPSHQDVNNQSLGEELYDVPATLQNINNQPQGEEIYDLPPARPNIRKQLQNDDIYDEPPARHNMNNQAQSEELYDIPPARQNNSHQSQSDDIYDQPPTRQDIRNRLQNQDIYDLPPSRQDAHNQSHGEELYDIPPARQNVSNQTLGEEIYDLPPARPNIRKQLQNDDIYDEPPSRRVNNQVQSEELYDIPPARQNNAYHPQSDDIYDQPSASHYPEDVYDVPSNDIYDEPPRGSSQNQSYQDDIYDHPSNRPLQDSVDGSQDIYDVPTQHDVGKVMQDIAQYQTSRQSLIKPYSKHRRERNAALAQANLRRMSEDDDDYVDYQDIYGKEPPADVVKEMDKNSETSPRSTPPKPVRKHSSFDQINMDAVKELKITQKQAYERLSKLHLAVDTSVTTLVSHTSGDWLEPKNLTFNIDAIKDMAGKVKLSLRLLTEFGLGAVVNAKVVDDTGNMPDLIKADIDPLLECYYKMKVCILHLDACKWKVPDVRHKESEKFFATVNAIMILGSRVPEACRKLTGTLHYCVRRLFPSELALGANVKTKSLTELASVADQNTRLLTERMGNVRLKSEPQRSPPEPVVEKERPAKPARRALDAKKVREILDLDTRSKSSWNWSEPDGLPSEKPEGADMSPGEMRKEFQSRRQKGYNSTLPRRPPVPPKPSLPTNRRSMATALPDEELRPVIVPSKVDTLVTDFVAEDGRKKYASDPTQSPMEPEPSRKPEWGGSCPQLDDPSSYVSPQAIGRATSSGTAASNTSTYSSSHDSIDDGDGVSGFNKMSSDSNLYSQTLLQPRVTAPASPTHFRSASLPWDENKIPFSSYEKEQRNSPHNSPRLNQKRLSKLDHRDSEALVFFLQKVESQVLILRDAVRNLTESVANNESPQSFVGHSKFVILTAHKVVHAGEELSGKLLNNDVKHRIRRASTQLADSIRGVVAGTKQAALEYPNQNSMMEMMTTVLSVGEAVREVHKEAKKGLEL